MPQTILVACNGKPASEAALDQAIALAQQLSARLRIVAVADGVEVETRVWIEAQRRSCLQLVESLQDRARRAGVDADTEVVEGVAATEIVRAAHRANARLIVLGHRQRGVLARCLEASVSKRVLDQAACPVLVCPSPETADTSES